jgi:hypothetical protein
MEYVVITLCDITRKSEPICAVFFLWGGGAKGHHWSVSQEVGDTMQERPHRTLTS